jgi:hypothetical protein
MAFPAIWANTWLAKCEGRRAYIITAILTGHLFPQADIAADMAKLEAAIVAV